jgi:hypothetical protein
VLLFGYISQPWKYVVLATISVFFSIGGVVWAAHKRCPADGGRGGAIATAVALAVIVSRPDYGLLIYEARRKRRPSNLTQMETILDELDSIAAAYEINSSGQKWQNWTVVGSTFVGTVVWGFGDVFAKWLT